MNLWVGNVIQKKKSNDKGIDGWDGYGDPIQIKNQRAKQEKKTLEIFRNFAFCEEKNRYFYLLGDLHQTQENL